MDKKNKPTLNMRYYNREIDDDLPYAFRSEPCRPKAAARNPDLSFSQSPAAF